MHVGTRVPQWGRLLASFAPARSALAFPTLLISALVITQGSIQAQGTGVLYGTVLSDPGDHPVMGAQVIVTSGRTAPTEAGGAFRIAGIDPGTYQVTVRHLGHRLLNAALTFTAGDSVGTDFVLVPEVPVLDTAHVVASAAAAFLTAGKMAGFFHRRQRHVGNAIDSVVLDRERSRPLAEILQSHFQIHVIRMIGGAGAIASPRGTTSVDPAHMPSPDAGDKLRGASAACYAQVYLDGIRVYTPGPNKQLFDVNSVQPSELTAAEFFSGPAQTPSEYGGTGASCGTLLLWTK